MTNVISLKPSLSECHAIEAEQAVMGAMFLNNTVIAIVSARLKPDHFFEGAHARLFEAMVEQFRDTGQCSAVTMAARFRSDASLQDMGGGAAYIARLAGSAPTIVNHPAYVDAIIDAYVRRQSLAVLEDMRADLMSGTSRSLTVVRETIKGLSELDEPTGRLSKRSAGAVAESVLTQVSEVMSGQTEGVRGVSTGFLHLAATINRWQRQRFYVIAGRPSMGKSTVSGSIIVEAAKAGANILLFSLEMGADECMERMLCALAWEKGVHNIAYDDLKRPGKVTDGQYQRLYDAKLRMDAMGIQIDDRTRVTLEQVDAALRAERSRLEALGKTLDVVVIDHCTIMAMPDRYRGNKVNEIEALTAGLKALAKEHDIALIGLVQLSRDVEKRDNKRPQLADLRGSGSWEQDADVVMLLYREAYYLERSKTDDASKEIERNDKLAEARHKLEVLVAKNRGGQCRDLEFWVDMGAGVMRDSY